MSDIDIGQITEALNDKMDRDAINRSDVGSGVMANMAMPSNTYIDIPFPAHDTVITAPADGWYNLCRRVGAGSDTERYLIGYNTITQFRVARCGGASWQELCLEIPVKKGDAIRILYNATGDIIISRFIYAVGSESEAS